MNDKLSDQIEEIFTENMIKLMNEPIRPDIGLNTIPSATYKSPLSRSPVSVDTTPEYNLPPLSSTDPRWRLSG